MNNADQTLTFLLACTTQLLTYINSLKSAGRAVKVGPAGSKINLIDSLQWYTCRKESDEEGEIPLYMDMHKNMEGLSGEPLAEPLW